MVRIGSKLTKYEQKNPPAFEYTANDCYIIVNRKLNADGYYRRRVKRGPPKMWHRTVWEQNRGPIPEGHEINHKCKNRACSNLDHLEVLPKSVHVAQNNRERTIKLETH